MRDPPPPQLAALLERLGLATASDVSGMAGRVSRLARDLPRFESVWVDALAQARYLTPFQAAEINAGRGDSLRCGDYLLCERLPWPAYATGYRARRVDSRQPVHLVVAQKRGQDAAAALRRLETLAGAAEKCRCEHVAPIVEAGSDGDRLWAAAPRMDGRSAADWMTHNGRFPPEVVLEIARAMLAGLLKLEQAGIVHGDLSAAGLTLTTGGGVMLGLPGLRPILRGEEGYGQADLSPAAYDYLAPERIADGTPPTVASDLYACGCLWWHLLCGRPPLAGGDSLAKLRAAHAAAVVDVRRFAPECPAPLAAAVSACTQRDPRQRPESMARLAATLGPPTRSGRQTLARCLARTVPLATRRSSASRVGRAWPAVQPSWAGAAICLTLAAAAAWSLWASRAPLPTANIAGAPPVVQASHLPGPKIPPPNGTSTTGETPVPQPVAADVLRLPAGPIDGRSLRLRAGQRVCGSRDARPAVRVPRAGLMVDAENVVFENIDFAWSDAAGEAAVAPPAVVHLRAGRVEFRGCLFHSGGAASVLPVAVSWEHPAAGGDAALSLPNGRLHMKDCLLRNVEAAVDCRTRGALAVEFTNVLHLGAGPLVRLDHWPKVDEPALIKAGQTTLRGAGPLVECRCQGEEQPGELSIQTADCVLAPRPGSPLLALSAPADPQRLLGGVLWTGQGSLVSPAAVVAAWLRPDGQRQPLDDAAISIAGVVRGEVAFAGEPQAGPGASRAVRWQAPLQSGDPPGIDPEPIPFDNRRP